MQKILKNYASSLILLSSIIVGGAIGLILGESASFLKPIGDIFLNLMFMVIVPLIFFSISSAVIGNGQEGRVGKILRSSLIVFVLIATFTGVIAYIATSIYNPFTQMNLESLQAVLEPTDTESQLTIGQMAVNTLTVSDFGLLLSKTHLLPLIIFSIIFGLSVAKAGEKGKPLAVFLRAGSATIMEFVHYIMKLAPIGLACYFAYTVGSLGPEIIGGYLQSLVWYILVTIICFFGCNTLFVFISGGVPALKAFWRNISAPALTAIATSSSSACIPINIIAAKKMGVSEDIAETVIPLGINTHKSGSVVGGVLKTIFLFTIYGRNIDLLTLLGIIGVGILSGIVVGAIPNGGVAPEILICTLFGFPAEMITAIIVVGTIIDIPATLLNSTTNISCALLVSKIIDGKNWIHNVVSQKTRNTAS